MDYDKLLSSSLQAVKPSGIRKFFDIAEEMDNVISLGVGEPDFKTPWHIRCRAIDTLEQGATRYTANAGMQVLREELSQYYARRFGLVYDSRSEVVVTVGGSEAIDLCVRAVVEPGDEVLIVEPSFVCYEPIVRVCGGVPVPLVTRQEHAFKLTARALEAAITPKTKLLILPYPNNPTGGVMRRGDLEEIAAVLRDTDIFILSDEIYAELTYGETGHVSIASLSGMRERTIIANGFSKCYSMTGWRLGYALAPAPVVEQMVKLHQFAIMSAPTTAQYAAVQALRHGDADIAEMRAEYDRRRRYTVHAFNEIGLDCFEPEGAFYCFPCIRSTGMTSEEFCERLIHAQRVAVVPGNAFGGAGEGFIRVSYCYAIANIKEAVRRIQLFLDSLEA